MQAKSESGRKERILEAAENAFADFGFEGASLRHIVLDAGVNLATVYYYFGSKEGLMDAVLRRRFEPLRQEGLDSLLLLRQQYGEQPIPVSEILEAMLAPPLRMALDQPNNQMVMRLVGRLITDPNAQTQKFFSEHDLPFRQAFLEAFKRSLPHLPLVDLLWRIEFLWGALAFNLCNPRNIQVSTGGLCNPLDTATFKAHLKQTFIACLQAPSLPTVPAMTA
jgi:AcrR family transcriptional regulator